MAKEELINFVKVNIPNISVTPAGLETIAAHFEEIEFSKNEFLLKQGKVSDYYYLASGFLRAFTFDEVCITTEKCSQLVAREKME